MAQASADLPALPAQARYIQLPGGLCQYGMIGGLLSGPADALLQADYAIIVSSDLRGPFLPGYYQVRQYGVSKFEYLPHTLGIPTCLVHQQMLHMPQLKAGRLNWVRTATPLTSSSNWGMCSVHWSVN